MGVFCEETGVMKAAAAIVVCALTLAVGAARAEASPVVVTNPALFATAGMVNIDFEDIVVPPGGTVPITNQYASKNLVFSAGLHTDTSFPALAPAILGGVAASNGDPGCCPSITMNFTGGGASRAGFDLISLDPAVTEVDVYTVLNGVSTFAGSLVLDTALEIKFFGIIMDPSDPAANFDSLVLTTLLAPNQVSGFIMDNVSFVPVPEPATLTLFGAGALAMARTIRRRRA
jgi:PEP-CTERM motif